MKNTISFIIPVRHPDNSKDWGLLKEYLLETARSIANQDATGWKVVVVANDGADIPALPAGFSIERVDFAPNPRHERGEAPDEIVHDAVRFDKGRRILAGMLHFEPLGHFMVVDDDDFVSRRLTSFVGSNPNANGWYFGEGYVWSHGKLLYRHSNFSRLCGTSHVIRADLFDLPTSIDSASDDYIKRMLGSHVYVQDILEAAGHRLEPLPFPGAVYRTGHRESHSHSEDILRRYLLRRNVLNSPGAVMKALQRLKLRTTGIDREFFGN